MPTKLVNGIRFELTADEIAQRETEHAAANALPVLQERAIGKLAARRYQAEEGGTVFGGNFLATDRTTQAKITAAYVKAVADPDYTIVAWKFAPGVFAPLDAATIIAAAGAVEAHVQACFAHEALLSGQIMAAADADALAAVDLDAGWP